MTKEKKFVSTLKTNIENSKKEDVGYCSQQDESKEKYGLAEMARELFELLEKKYPEL